MVQKSQTTTWNLKKTRWSMMGYVDLRSPQRDVPLSGLVFAASLEICCFWLGGPMGNERWSKVTKMKDGKGLWTCFSNIHCIMYIYIYILEYTYFIASYFVGSSTKISLIRHCNTFFSRANHLSQSQKEGFFVPTLVLWNVIDLYKSPNNLETGKLKTRHVEFSGNSLVFTVS